MNHIFVRNKKKESKKKAAIFSTFFKPVFHNSVLRHKDSDKNVEI